MGDVAVGKDHLLNFLFDNQRFEFFFCVDGNTAGVERSAQRWRVATVFDSRDLSRGERHDFVFGVVTEADIESVKISPCRTHNEDALPVGYVSAIPLKFFRTLPSSVATGAYLSRFNRIDQGRPPK